MGAQAVSRNRRRKDSLLGADSHTRDIYTHKNTSVSVERGYISQQMLPSGIFVCLNKHMDIWMPSELYAVFKHLCVMFAFDGKCAVIANSAESHNYPIMHQFTNMQDANGFVGSLLMTVVSHIFTQMHAQSTFDQTNTRQSTVKWI